MMNITTDEPLVFYNEEAERAEAAERAREEEAIEENTYGRYGDNPFLRKSRILSITRSRYDDPDELRLAREYDEKTRTHRHKTSRSTGNFGLDILTTLTFSPYAFKEGLGTFKTFFYLGRYKPGQDGPSRAECDRLSMHKREIFWESFISLKFLKGAVPNVAVGLMSFYWVKLATVGLSFKHPMKILWFLFALMVLWNTFKIFIKSILNVMEATYGTVMGRKEDADKARKNAEAAEEKARKEAEEARRARDASNTQSGSGQSEELPTTNRFTEFFSGD